ncbi:hypothetical protein [Acinetobacter baumannii]|uniref:hypothetical protein n=1 Tax=Acinetobacter baumannii TaxID=470 RepID=UPI00264DBC83|nr:hypothetical protein [Acinetobacter baumannii]
MSEVNAKDEVLKILQESINEQKKVKEKNEEIKGNILTDIEVAIEYLNELKDGSHIAPEALKEQPDLLPNNIYGINACLRYADQLKNLISSISVEYDDLSYLSTLKISLQNIKFEYFQGNFFLLPKNLGDIQGSLVASESFIRTLYVDKARYNNIVNTHINAMLQDAERELNDFRTLKNTLKNLKSVDYYSQEFDKYMKRHHVYLGLFLITILVALTITVVSVCSEPKFFLDKFDYWFLKGSFVLVVITLVSYFIKQSSHYQGLADQANQTRLELQAFPTFITGVEKADEVAIRKELALKYFGREVDKTAHKDMCNLVSDQMKNTTEMVKATTEAIKNLKG